MLKVYLERALHHSNEWLQSEMTTWLSDITREPSLVIFRKLKAICEIGYLEFFVNPLPDTKIQNGIARQIESLILDETFKSLVRHNTDHSNLFIPLLSICLLNKTGNREMTTDAENLLKINLLSSKEKLPFREIDLLHISYKITSDGCYLDQMAQIARFGCLGKYKNILSFSASDEYAITHTVFYITDFGKLDWNENILPKKQLCTLVTILSEQAKLKNDLDIFGEYLLCKQYLNFPENEIEEGLSVLYQLQNKETGFWNGPTELEKVLTKDGFKPESFPFFKNYHTSIVVRLAVCNYLAGDKNESNTENSLMKRKDLEIKTLFCYKEKILINRLHPDYRDIFKVISKYQKKKISEIPESIFTNPVSILLGLDLLHLFCREEENRTKWRGEIFSEILDVNLLKENYNTRFIRIWCLLRSSMGEINNSIADTLISKCQLLLNFDEDKCVILLLLYGFVSDSYKFDIHKTISSFIIKSITEKEIRSINYIILYGLDHFELIEDYWNEIFTLFLSMNAVTSSYGWLENAQSDDANFYDLISLITAIKLNKNHFLRIRLLK